MSPASMNLFKCSLCFQPSIEYPQDFQVVLSDFIGVFNKFQPCCLELSDGTNLNLCRSCWIYFMRIHKLDQQLSVKKENCEAKGNQLLIKIRQGQRSLQNSGKSLTISEDVVQVLATGNNNKRSSAVGGQTQDTDSAVDGGCALNKSDDSDIESVELFEISDLSTPSCELVSASVVEKPVEGTSVDDGDCESHEAERTALRKDFEVQTLTSENPEEEDAEVSGRSQDPYSAVVAGCSSTKSDDDSETESLDSVSTERSAVEEELTEKESADKNDSYEPKAVKPAYENKWLPFNLTKLKYSPVVKRLSEVDFIYDEKYPFQGTSTGFKCGLCPAICAFYKDLPIWSNMIGHMKRWHRGKGVYRVRANKVLQRLIEIAPNRFQYGKYFVDKIDESYRCEECGDIKPAGPKNKAANIMEHITRKHENPKTHVCEYCGKVFKYLHGLRNHRLTQHEKPSDTFPCSDCDKTFVSRTKALHHHKVVHQRIYKGKKLICEICGKECGQKIALENHVAFVHNGQKIECKDCGKMFASQPALATHRNSHTGKKYTCDICGMEFTQHYSVTRHKKTAHPE